MAAEMIPAPACVQVEKMPGRVKRHCTSLHIIKVLIRQIVWCRPSRLSALQRLFTLHDTTSPWDMGHFPRYSSGIIWLNYTINVTCAKPTWLSDMQLDATTLHTLTFVGSDSIHTTPLLRYPKSLPRGKNIFPKARLASHGIQAQTRNVPEAVQWGLPKLKRLTGKSDHRFVSASPVDSPVTMPWSL